MANPIRLMLVGAALALPATLAAQDKAAQEPVTIKERRVVIIERDGKAQDNAAGIETRVVEKDGKTIVIKTSKAMSEAEIDAKVAAAMAATRDVAPGSAAPDGGERRVIVKRFSHDSAPHDTAGTLPDREKIEAACASGKSSLIESSEGGADGKKRKVTMRFCSTGADLAKAGDGLKAARERISKDANLSPAIREDILKQLDAEIERLAKQG